MSTATELREKTPQELDQLIADTRRVLLDLRFQNASGELDDTAALRRARRELARALTVARERRAGEPVATPAAPAEPEAEAAETTEETTEEIDE
ncbi:MAG: 50S ribosomal protein L29 [Acidobacteria bacterium]|nr:50S ribosomal protein L29 [Acidobacteriota bacterium]